jgi:predicted MFS family arabinose efflux permease
MESTHGSRWYLVGLLTVIAALNYADRSAMSGVISVMRDDLQLSPIMLGAVGSAFLWVYAICSPASGYFADRWPRPRVIVWSLVAWSTVTLLTGLARTGTELLIARCLLGLAECAYVPAAIGLTAEYHPGDTRARAIGIQLAGYNAGVILGGVFAGYAGDHWGWRPAFWVLGILGLLVAVVAQRTIPRESKVAEAGE